MAKFRAIHELTISHPTKEGASLRVKPGETVELSDENAALALRKGSVEPLDKDGKPLGFLGGPLKTLAEFKDAFAKSEGAELQGIHLYQEYDRYKDAWHDKNNVAPPVLRNEPRDRADAAQTSGDAPPKAKARDKSAPPAT